MEKHETAWRPTRTGGSTGVAGALWNEIAPGDTERHQVDYGLGRDQGYAYMHNDIRSLPCTSSARTVHEAAWSSWGGGGDHVDRYSGAKQCRRSDMTEVSKAEWEANSPITRREAVEQAAEPNQWRPTKLGGGTGATGAVWNEISYGDTDVHQVNYGLGRDQGYAYLHNDIRNLPALPQRGDGTRRQKKTPEEAIEKYIARQRETLTMPMASFDERASTPLTVRKEWRDRRAGMCGRADPFPPRSGRAVAAVASPRGPRSWSEAREFTSPEGILRTEHIDSAEERRPLSVRHARESSQHGRQRGACHRLTTPRTAGHGLRWSTARFQPATPSASGFPRSRSPNPRPVPQSTTQISSARPATMGALSSRTAPFSEYADICRTASGDLLSLHSLKSTCCYEHALWSSGGRDRDEQRAHTTAPSSAWPEIWWLGGVEESRGSKGGDCSTSARQRTNDTPKSLQPNRR